MKKRYSSMEKMKKLWFLFIVVAIGNVCANAIAQTTSTTIPPACDITVDPKYKTFFTYEGTRGLQFSPTLEGNCNDPCYTWDIIQDGSMGSTVNNHGKYYPGDSEGTDIVRVTDPCNENISEIAVVNYISYPTYEPPECYFKIRPGNDVTHIGETLQFSVGAYKGCSNASCLSWDITEAGSYGSTIDAHGLYTAGSTPGTDVITVTDACNESISASVTVSVGPVPATPYKFNRMWPTLSQPWYFNHPTRIIVDEGGYVYVGQYNPPCIHKFTSDGQFVTRWGRRGVGEGEFDIFGCMAVDKNGFVYVADAILERIQKFTSDGQFVSEWGNFGPGDEEIHNPYNMVIDENGFFYIADFHGIKKFASDGHFVTKWGSKCDRYDGSGCEDPDGDGPLELGDGQFDMIAGMTIDENGFVYVLDKTNTLSTPRIQKFTFEGEFVNKWEIDTSEFTNFEEVNAIALDRNGFMYVSFDANIVSGGILKFSPDGQLVDKWGGYGSGDDELGGPWNIAVDMNGYVYVSEHYADRIRKFSSDGQPVDTWKSWGTGEGEFFRPFDIEIDMDGFVYVHELYSSRTQKFTPEGQFVETLPSHGQLKEIDSNNFLYYIDNNVDDGRIKKVSFDGEIVAQWNRTGSGDTVLLNPCDVAVDMHGFVYVADQGYDDFSGLVGAYPTHHILKFTSDGQFVEKWGRHGDGEDELSSVWAIAVDMNGFVYVCTGEWAGQIKKFTAEGQFVTTWNADCWDITVDTNGFVYCGDTDPYLEFTGPKHRLLKFTSDGQFVDTWGSIGSDPGQVLGIGSIEVGPNNEVYITDVMNHRIQVFKETSPIPSISVTPRAIMQSRWMPMVLLMRIVGTETHFDGSSQVTFDPPSAVIALPILEDDEHIWMIGLMMSAWLMSTQSIYVTVTTGTEVVSEELNLEFPFMMTK